MESTTMGVLLVIAAAIFWGVGNTIARVGLQSLKVTSATILSLAAGLVVALIIVLLFDFKSLLSVTLVAIGWFALIGVLHFALGRFFLYQSIRYIGAARGVSIAGSAPLFTLILAIIFLAETPTIPVVMGTVSIVGGLFLLLSESGDTRLIKKNRISGYSFGLATALCWAAINVLVKHSSQSSSPFVILSFALLFGILVLLATTGKNFEIGIKTNKKAISLLLLAGLLNGIGLAGLYAALALAPVVVVAPLAATSPLITIACVHLFLQRLERVTIQIVIGGLFVVIGGGLVTIY